MAQMVGIGREWIVITAEHLLEDADKYAPMVWAVNPHCITDCGWFGGRWHCRGQGLEAHGCRVGVGVEQWEHRQLEVGDFGRLGYWFCLSH
jgi:hypothetical protein